MFALFAVDRFGCAYDMRIITTSLSREEAVAHARFYCGDVIYVRFIREED